MCTVAQWRQWQGILYIFHNTMDIFSQWNTIYFYNTMERFISSLSELSQHCCICIELISLCDSGLRCAISLLAKDQSPSTEPVFRTLFIPPQTIPQFQQGFVCVEQSRVWTQKQNLTRISSVHYSPTLDLFSSCVITFKLCLI